nr:hypothetical protein [Tanacetum cinerariifolium]
MILIRILSIALPIPATLHTSHTRLTRDSCGNDSHFGYDCQPQFLLNYESEPGYIENYNSYPYDSSSFPQQYPCCTHCGCAHETCQCDQLIFDEPHCKNCGGPHMNFQCQPMNQNFYNFNSSGFDQSQPPQSPVIHQPSQEMNIQEIEDLKQQYFDEMKLTPSLSTEEPDNSLSIGDEHLDTITVTEPDKFIKSSVENLIPIPSEFEGIPNNMCDVPFHDNFPPLDISKDQFEDFSDFNDEFSLTDDDSFSIDNIDYVEASPPDSELVSSEIEALNDNPTSSFDFMTMSSSTSLNSLLEETNTFDNSLSKFETFCFDLEEISSGSTTTRSDISLPEYEAFYDDRVKEISSGSTTTHSDSSLYDLFIFDLSFNPFPPADRSDFYEFADELIHIISPPEYDCFFFKIEPNSGDFTMDVVEDISPTKEPRVHNALSTHPNLQLNLEFKLSGESLFTYVVWIFLPFLLYSVAPQYLLFLGSEDTIFDPGICNYHFLGRMYLIGVELSQDPKS